MIFKNPHIYDHDRKSQQLKKWWPNVFLCRRIRTSTIPLLPSPFRTHSSRCSWFPFRNVISHNAWTCWRRNRAEPGETKWWRAAEKAAGVDVDLLVLMVLLFSECNDGPSDYTWMSSFTFSPASPGHLHTHTHTHRDVSFRLETPLCD